jgi:hypothetical protein
MSGAVRSCAVLAGVLLLSAAGCRPALAQSERARLGLGGGRATQPAAASGCAPPGRHPVPRFCRLHLAPHLPPPPCRRRPAAAVAHAGLCPDPRCKSCLGWYGTTCLTCDGGFKSMGGRCVPESEGRAVGARGGGGAQQGLSAAAASGYAEALVCVSLGALGAQPNCACRPAVPRVPLRLPSRWHP